MPAWLVFSLTNSISILRRSWGSKPVYSGLLLRHSQFILPPKELWLFIASDLRRFRGFRHQARSHASTRTEVLPAVYSFWSNQDFIIRRSDLTKDAKSRCGASKNCFPLRCNIFTFWGSGVSKNYVLGLIVQGPGWVAFNWR